MFEAMNLMKIFIYDVSISHRDLNTRMAKKLLNVDDIGIIPKQIGRERVTKRVRVDILSTNTKR